MSEVQLDFPDLDGALAVSRVEVVSNVEVAAIKGALRWVFEELQRQHAAKQLSDAAALQQQIQDALSACKEQKAAIESLQDRQVRILLFACRPQERSRCRLLGRLSTCKRILASTETLRCGLKGVVRAFHAVSLTLVA